MKEAVIKTEKLTKRFGDFIAANEISFEVDKGEIFGFLGANGAGKTTLFDIIAGDNRADRGSIFLKGIEITGARPDLVARLGIARTFQTPRSRKCDELRRLPQPARQLQTRPHAHGERQ